jgi:hypothetical protein
MANTRTITAANSVLLLSAASLFDVPQRIQGFQADDVTDTENMATSEIVPGVDGRLSGGWSYVPTVQNFMLQADSPSVDFFDQIHETMQTLRETIVLNGSLVLPAIGKKYAMTRGFLTGYSKFGGVKKTLQGRRFSVTWERVTVSNT